VSRILLSGGEGGLGWEEEQERLILEARLLASSPEVVFEELKRLSAKTVTNRWWNAETAKKALDVVRASLVEMQKAVATLTTRVSELRSIVVVCAVFLAIMIYFRFK
jgi:hypothetical protein